MPQMFHVLPNTANGFVFPGRPSSNVLTNYTVFSTEELVKLDWMETPADAGLQVGLPRGEERSAVPLKVEQGGTSLPDHVPAMSMEPSKRVVTIHSKKQKPFSKRPSPSGPVSRSTGGHRKHDTSDRASRWTRDKTKMGDLEHEAHEKQALADEMEKENKMLRLKTAAMEHALAAREKQMMILSDYNRLCGPGLRPASSPEAQEIHVAATATIPSLAAKLQAFVNEASLLLLHISDCEGRREPADKQIVLQLSAMVVDMCNRVLCPAFVLNPKIQFEILTHRLDCLEAGPSNPDDGHWDRIAMEVHPTQQQVDELAQCWELKNTRVVTKVQPELDYVVGELADALNRNCSLRIHELHRRLAAAECKEAMCYRAFCYMLFGRILTPMQFGRVLVHSFPYFPNSRELAVRLLQMRVP